MAFGLLLVGIGGAAAWEIAKSSHDNPRPTDETAEPRPAEEPARVAHDASGQAVITLDEDTQRRIGLKTEPLREGVL